MDHVFAGRENDEDHLIAAGLVLDTFGELLNGLGADELEAEIYVEDNSFDHGHGTYIRKELVFDVVNELTLMWNESVEHGVPDLPKQPSTTIELDSGHRFHVYLEFKKLEVSVEPWQVTIEGKAVVLPYFKCSATYKVKPPKRVMLESHDRVSEYKLGVDL